VERGTTSIEEYQIVYRGAQRPLEDEMKDKIAKGVKIRGLDVSRISLEEFRYQSALEQLESLQAELKKVEKDFKAIPSRIPPSVSEIELKHQIAYLTDKVKEQENRVNLRKRSLPR